MPVEQSEGADGLPQRLGLHEEEFDLGKGIEDFHRFAVVMATFRDGQRLKCSFDPAAQRRYAGGEFVGALRGKSYNFV